MTDHAEALAKALEAARDQFRRYGDIVISGDEAEAYLAYLATPAPVAGTEPAGEVVETWRRIAEHDGSDRQVEVYRAGDHFYAWFNSKDAPEPYWDADLEYGGRPIDPPPSHFREIVGPSAALRDQSEA